jgi:hypothetical protein
MFIQTESTPNPRTLKFLPGRDVLGAGSREFVDADAALASPLASILFDVDGVERVYLGGDFLTITKSDAVEWPHLKPHVLAAIMDHFTSGRPVLAEAGALADDNDADDAAYEGEAADIVKELRAIIEARVRPAVARWRRHHLPLLGSRARRRAPQYARLLRRLPVLHADLEAGHREHAQTLRA